jgi:hypothetical protein
MKHKLKRNKKTKMTMPAGATALAALVMKLHAQSSVDGRKAG